jgi:hypothetical protein
LEQTNTADKKKITKISYYKITKTVEMRHYFIFSQCFLNPKFWIILISLFTYNFFDIMKWLPMCQHSLNKVYLQCVAILKQC